MNKASSEYVDKIVVQTILETKLRKVHHAPEALQYPCDELFFGDFSSVPTLPVECLQKDHRKNFYAKSHIHTGYLENDSFLVECRQAAESTGKVLLVHGLFEEDYEIYKYLIPRLNENHLDVFLFPLPYHMNRKPAQSSFSGEFFWSAHLYRTAQAFKQTVYDLYQFYNYIKNINSEQRVIIVSYSMGGGLCLRMASLYDKVDGIFAINPVSHIAKLNWENPLCSTIKRDLLEHSYSIDSLIQLYRYYDPMDCSVPEIAHQKIAMAKSLYDGLVNPQDYIYLAQKWHFQKVLEYNAGHINILRVPKLVNDIMDFWNEVSNKN